MTVAVIYKPLDIMEYVHGNTATEALVKLNLFRAVSRAERTERPLYSLLRRAARAVVRFWDQGGSSVEALYSARFDGEHFVESHGDAIQSYGGNSAFKPARSRRPSIQEEYRTLRRVLGSEKRFVGSAPSLQDQQQKAS